MHMLVDQKYAHIRVCWMRGLSFLFAFASLCVVVAETELLVKPSARSKCVGSFISSHILHG